MYAIVATGGKQYTVETNSVIDVEKLDANVGDKVNLEVIMICNDGKVAVADDLAASSCLAEVLAHDKANKINIFKYKAKKNVRKRQGHRQPFTRIKITAINA